MQKIAFLGECMVELSGQAFGTISQGFGGDTLNSAIYLSRLAENVSPFYITSIGSDRLSQQLVELWEAEGIDTSLVLKDADNNTGLYQISVDEQGERTFTYWRKGSAASQMVKHPSFNLIGDAILAMDIVYLSGISVAILPEEDKQQLLEVLTRAKRHGVKIIFDSNYRPKLWDSEQHARDWYKKVLPLCDHALITFDDEVLLWQDEQLSDAVERIQSCGVTSFVLKLGSEGSALFENGKLHYVPTTKVDYVVDTTSAGDSFNAGFIYGLVKNLPYKECCRVGNELAGLVIQHHGAIIPKPITDTLKKRIEK